MQGTGVLLSLLALQRANVAGRHCTWLAPRMALEHARASVLATPAERFGCELRAAGQDGFSVRRANG